MRVLFHVLLIIVSLGLIAAVLLQKGKSAGLSGAITGGAEQPIVEALRTPTASRFLEPRRPLTRTEAGR